MTEIEKLHIEISDLQEKVKVKKVELKILNKSQRPIFSRRLEKLRCLAGMTQKIFSEKLNLPRAVYASYERGDREPPMKNLIKIADGLNVSLDWLCGRTDEMKN